MLLVLAYKYFAQRSEDAWDSPLNIGKAGPMREGMLRDFLVGNNLVLFFVVIFLIYCNCHFYFVLLDA